MENKQTNNSVGDKATIKNDISLNHVFKLDKMNQYEIENFITFDEKVNLDYLRMILSDFDQNYELLGRFKDHKNGFKQIIDKSTIKTILEKRLKHGNIFTYKSDGGRLIPNGYSCCMMNKILRHTIAGENNIDIDINNCHPVILSWYCKIKNWSCEHLNNYINNRETLLNDCMIYYEIDKGSAKTKILSLLNNQNDGFNDESPLFNLYNEIKFLQDFISKDRKDLFKKAKQRKNGIFNPLGVCMSLFLQEIENKICQCMIKYCKKTDIHVSAPCYDGLLINIKCDIPMLLTNLQNYIFENLDIKITLSEKKMDQGICDELKKTTDVKIHDYSKNDYLLDKFEKEIDYYDIYSIDIFVENKYVRLEMIEKWLYNTIIIFRNGGRNPSFISIKKDKNLYGNPIYVKTFDITHNDLTHKLFYPQITLKYDEGINFIDDKLKKKYKDCAFVDVQISEIFNSLYYSSQLQWVDTIEFEPYFFKNEKSNKLNLFDGFDLLDDNKYYDNKISNFENSCIYIHICKYLCDNDEILYNYLLDVIAHSIQCPNQKLNQCILICSEQGNFKDGLLEFWGKLLNIDEKYSTVFQDIDIFFKNFNSGLEGKILIGLNEIAEGGIDNSAFKRHNQLKGMITQRTIRIEKKNHEAYHVKDYARFIAFTNHENSLMVENSDRRLVMIKSNNNNVGDSTYFEPLFKCLTNIDYLKDAFSYFATRDLSNFNPFKAPESKYKRDQKLNCLSNSLKFIKDIWDNFDLDDDFRIHGCDLYSLFNKYCKDYGVKSVSRQSLNTNLSKIGVHYHPIKFNYNKKEIETNNTNSCGVNIRTKLGSLLQCECYSNYPNNDIYISKRVGFHINKSNIKTLLENYLRIENIDM